MGKLTISMAMFNSYYVSWPEGMSQVPNVFFLGNLF